MKTIANPDYKSIRLDIELLIRWTCPLQVVKGDEEGAKSTTAKSYKGHKLPYSTDHMITRNPRSVFRSISYA